MRHRTLRRIIYGWVFLIIVVALIGKVSVAASNGGRTAADFLLIGVGAKAAGMGGAYTAVSNGAVASYWNPAGLSGVEGGELVLGHFSWFQDITLEHGTLAYQIKDKTAVAASITFLNYGQIDACDADGVAAGEIAAYDWCGALSVGMRTDYNVSFGLSGKFINQKLDNLNASAFGADLGVKYQTERLALAAVIANVGTDMGFDGIKERLPTTARLAVAAHPFSERFMTALELEKKIFGGTVIRNGFEINFSDQYYLRTGYSYHPTHEERAFGSGVSIGAGVRFTWGEVDYAFTPKEQYSSETLHRLSFVLKFNQK